MLASLPAGAWFSVGKKECGEDVLHTSAQYSHQTLRINKPLQHGVCQQPQVWCVCAAGIEKEVVCARVICGCRAHTLLQLELSGRASRSRVSE